MASPSPSRRWRYVDAVPGSRCVPSQHLADSPTIRISTHTGREPGAGGPPDPAAGLLGPARGRQPGVWEVHVCMYVHRALSRRASCTTGHRLCLILVLLQYPHRWTHGRVGPPWSAATASAATWRGPPS
jgi:hypothetical protein